MTMEDLTLQDRSVYYFIKDYLATVSTEINVVDSFPEQLLVLPTVSVDVISLTKMNFALGERKLVPRMWYIDIFAQTKIQRDDLGYKIFNYLDNPIPVYDYNQGFPPATVPILSYLQAVDDTVELEPKKVLPDETGKLLYYRSTISFLAYYSKF